MAHTVFQMLSSTQIFTTAEIKMYSKLYCLDVQGINVNTDQADLFALSATVYMVIIKSHTYIHTHTSNGPWKWDG